MVDYEEGAISSFVWKFVKSVVDNPIKAGILALIISGFLGKTKKKEESVHERIKHLSEFIKSGEELVELLNKHAFIPIKNEKFAAELINERLKNLNHPIFGNLSSDKSSGKLFDKRLFDPTLGAFFENIDYLSKHKGNKIDQSGPGKSVDAIIEVIKSGKKLSDIPGFSLAHNDVGEGNHRVEALRQLGYKSCPVQFWSGWD